MQKSTFPFTIQNSGGRFTIIAEIENKALYPKYYNLFQKYGLSGNGQTWSDLIRQILQKQAPDLLSKIELDPEVGAFFAYTRTEMDRNRMLQIVVPIFSNMKKLEEQIKQADHTKFDD